MKSLTLHTKAALGTALLLLFRHGEADLTLGAVIHYIFTHFDADLQLFQATLLMACVDIDSPCKH